MATFRFSRVRALGALQSLDRLPPPAALEAAWIPPEFLCVWVLASAVDKWDAPYGLLLLLLISVSGCFQLERWRGFAFNHFTFKKNMNLITSQFKVLFSKATE